MFSRQASPLFLFLGILIAAPCLLVGCGGDGADAADHLPSTARPQRDPRLVEAQIAFERGQPDVARTLLTQAMDVDPVDRVALEARLDLAEGDPMAALSSLGKAKQRWPDDGRIWAAEIELYAFLQRMQGAQNSLEEGLEKAGECPELLRSRAIMALSIPGGAELGMLHLDNAFKLDPNLPFARHAQAQAHLLVGNMEIQRKAPAEALKHARMALEWDALDADYRALEAESLAALLRYDEALERYSELAAEGRENQTVRASLHHSAATAALMNKDRAGAVQHYLAARALGLPAEDLGFGKSVLEEECELAVARGTEHYEAGAFEEARAAFQHALEFDPDNLTARNHLGVTCYRLVDFDRAARAWRIVFEESERRGLELPEPVHLNLARVLYLQKNLPEARGACDTYLDAHPDGPWAEDTRAFLTELEIASLNGDR